MKGRQLDAFLFAILAVLALHEWRARRMAARLEEVDAKARRAHWRLTALRGGYPVSRNVRGAL